MREAYLRPHPCRPPTSTNSSAACWAARRMESAPSRRTMAKPPRTRCTSSWRVLQRAGQACGRLLGGPCCGCGCHRDSSELIVRGEVLHTRGHGHVSADKGLPLRPVRTGHTAGQRDWHHDRDDKTWLDYGLHGCSNRDGWLQCSCHCCQLHLALAPGKEV